MDLAFPPEEQAFRQEVRAFIEGSYPPELRRRQDAGEELSREEFLSWHRILAAKGGWSAPHWPKESGGPGGGNEYGVEIQSPYYNTNACNFWKGGSGWTGTC